MAKRGGWTRWTETTAAAVLREQRDSGLSMAEFARRRGVHPRRLYRWNARLPPVEAELSGDLEVPSLVPIRVGIPKGGKYKSVAAGHEHTCALRTDGTLACWGHNDQPERVAPAGKWLAVASGWRHSCAIRSDNRVACWGTADAQGSTVVPGGVVLPKK